jgi:hypothetical protein
MGVRTVSGFMNAEFFGNTEQQTERGLEEI